MKKDGARRGFSCLLKAERVSEYLDIHQAVWPEVLSILKREGFSHYTIFLSVEQCTLFSSFEYTGENLEKATQQINADPVAAKWNLLTQSCFEHSRGWQPLLEVFHLD